MVDFDKDRESNVSAFELTGGPASSGLTVRDWFAAQFINMHRNTRPITKARQAYEMADAMMEYRNKSSKLDCTPLDCLELTVRSANVLRAEGIDNMGDLLQMTSQQVMMLPNCGLKTLREIQESLARNGYALLGDPPASITVEQAFGFSK